MHERYWKHHESQSHDTATCTYQLHVSLFPHSQMCDTWKITGMTSNHRHEMSSERRQRNCKYLNLHPVIMSDCSVTHTQNSHAKHNKSVGSHPERRQTRLLSLRATKSGKSKETCVCWKALTIYLDENNPCIPRHMPIHTNQSRFLYLRYAKGEFGNVRMWAQTKGTCIFEFSHRLKRR